MKKKIFAMCLALLFVFVCVACTGASDDSSSDGSQESTSEVISPASSGADSSSEIPALDSSEDDSSEVVYDDSSKTEEEWIVKSAAEFSAETESDDLTIIEIRDDCFFARHMIPMPYTVKINGSLKDEWCVGDNVLVEYNNVYTMENKIEGDLVSIKKSDFELDPNVCYKPVIYLYPKSEIEISVRLTLDGKLTCTYPHYTDAWKVTASPDGTLTDEKGQTYNYLYWEGETKADWDTSRGFCVKGEDTAAFLEDSLAKLGLNRKEANEFIVYWLPLMQNNAYNVISFQTEAYTDAAKLDIAPSPDTLIRVFMTYKAADAYVEIAPQELTAPERTGFTVVEWGGTEIK